MDYDKTAMPRNYDAGRSYSPEVMARWLALFAAQVAVGQVATILDLGCGTGRFSAALAGHFGARPGPVSRGATAPPHRLNRLVCRRLAPPFARFDVVHADQEPRIPDQWPRIVEVRFRNITIVSQVDTTTRITIPTGSGMTP